MAAQEWTMAQAKRDFENGHLVGVEFATAFGEPGWCLILTGSGLAGRGGLVDARSHKTRVFKTLDAAVSAAREIGFEVVALTVKRIG